MYFSCFAIWTSKHGCLRQSVRWNQQILSTPNITAGDIDQMHSEESKREESRCSFQETALLLRSSHYKQRFWSSCHKRAKVSHCRTRHITKRTQELKLGHVLVHVLTYLQTLNSHRFTVVQHFLSIFLSCLTGTERPSATPITRHTIEKHKSERKLG